MGNYADVNVKRRSTLVYTPIQEVCAVDSLSYCTNGCGRHSRAYTEARGSVKFSGHSNLGHAYANDAYGMLRRPDARVP